MSIGIIIISVLLILLLLLMAAGAAMVIGRTQRGPGRSADEARERYRKR